MRRIFISATSRDLGSYRRAVRDVLRRQGVLPEVQEHFPPDYYNVIQLLEDKIQGCDAVICLVGWAYGQEPRRRPAEARRRSYTQLEYNLARRLGKPVYLFLAANDCPSDAPIKQRPALRKLQVAYRAALRWSGQSYSIFRSVADLERKIARIAWPTPRTDKASAAVRVPHNLPYHSLGSLFKGRDAILATLQEHLCAAPGQDAALVSKSAIHGLGGVGKTCLAVEYAWRHQAEYSAQLFVPADTPASLRRNLASLTAPQILHLPEHQSQDEEIQVAATLAWLHTYQGWLLILDDVDAEDAAAAVETLLPQLHHGQVLITSRLHRWSLGITALELDLLPAAEAVAFMLERTAGRRRTTLDDATEAQRLVAELEGLALALEQAGAYIAERRCTFTEYLRRWRSQEAQMRTWCEPRLMHYPRSVVLTWGITLEQLDAPARALCNLLAWLAPAPMPLMLLESVEARQICATALAGSKGQARVLEVDLEQACSTLLTFSMACWEGDTSLRVHRLVQEISRARLPEAAHSFWLTLALQLVNAALPEESPPHDVRSWPIWELLQPHVASLVDRADAAGVPTPTARLMSGLGLFLKAKGVFAEAEPLYRRALAIAEAAYGPTHRTVAFVLNNLAGLLRATQRLTEAEPLYRRALGILATAYGVQHPSTQTITETYQALLTALHCPATQIEATLHQGIHREA